MGVNILLLPCHVVILYSSSSYEQIFLRVMFPVDQVDVRTPEGSRMKLFEGVKIILLRSSQLDPDWIIHFTLRTEEFFVMLSSFLSCVSVYVVEKRSKPISLIFCGFFHIYIYNPMCTHSQLCLL